MAADRCSAETLKKCKEYVVWKRSWKSCLHDWALRNHYYGYPSQYMRGFCRTSSNRFSRIWFRFLWWLKEITALTKPHHSLTPNEKIIVGMILLGQYEGFSRG